MRSRALFLTTCLVLGAALGAGEAGTALIHLRGALALRPELGLLGRTDELSLHQACEQLRRAFRADETTIALDLTGGFFPGLAAAEELVAVLGEKPAGKRLVCLADGLDDAGWLVARACDEISAVEAGFLAVDGLALEVDYYAGALEKIGVRFHAVTSGPQKTGPEPLVATGPSEAAKAEFARLLAGIDAVLVAGSTADGFDAAALRRARAASPQPGDAVVDLGLAHRAVEPGAWRLALPAPVRRIAEGDDLPDPSTFAGMMALWARLINGPAEVRLPEVVAVVELEGTIVDGGGGTPGTTIAALDVTSLLADLGEDDRIKAVVVRINSGGGGASASDRIYHALERLDAQKPVVALFDGVAASGGYYLACGAREILAHRGTITGSIGVFSLMPDLAETWRMLGIGTYALKTDPRADLFTAGAFTDEKRAALTGAVEAIDARFQGIVAAARGLAPERVAALADGKVYLGAEAVELGLVDRLGTLADAVVRARTLAGIETPLPVERHPKALGLARLLQLFQLRALVPGAMLPAILDDLATAARRARPVTMAWSAVPRIR